ncbi:hypothetical protein RRG08_035775 [Elysia crispata]|uniref:Uncharacterized protein n=1 Tax=Elysia crispata TaxID=231223 RepID=A0AAE1DJ49_9GAST|nr:hypothetical protein RRG08_035775 [Elysia crispata]
MAGEEPVGALRVSQLDASELDREVFSLTKSQISQLFKYHGCLPIMLIFSIQDLPVAHMRYSQIRAMNWQ